MNLRASVLTTAWVLIAAAAVYASPVGDCPPVDPLDHTDHLPDSKNCSLFYKCDHAAPVLFVCPDGLHFNRKLEVCDWPDRAGCSGGSGAGSTAAPASSPATASPSGDCPAVGSCPQYEDENSIAKHLPHASNCSQFCKCDHGKPVTFDCPAGLHFNPTLEVCDWPYRAGCTGGSGSTASPSSPTAAPTTATPTPAPTSAPPQKPTSAPSRDCPAVGSCPEYEDENSIAKHLPHASNCSQFCKCDHGKPVTFDCPAGLHFNPALEVCDWPYHAGCADGSDSTAAPSSPTDAPTTATPTAAPTSTPTPKPTSAPSADCPAVGCCPQNEDENSIPKLLPHASNCSQYCKCEHGKPVTVDCPAPLRFNPALEMCDWPYAIECPLESGSTAAPCSPTDAPTTAAPTAAPTPAPTPKPTSAPPGDCPAVGSCPQYEDENSIAKHLPHASNCSQFCKCDHGRPVTFDCPAALHFNPALEVCDWPYRAGCADGSDSTAASSSPTVAPTTAAPTVASTSAPTPKPTSSPSGECPAVGSCPQYEDENSIAKHLPHASNCSQFCKCDHGKPVTFDCPAGLHFNPALEVCDWPYRAGCAGGSGSTAAPSSPTAAPPTAAPTTAAPTPAPTSAPTPKPTSAPSRDCPAVGSCPQYEDENSIAKHLPHASNCSQFCKCDHGRPVTFDCPAGLHFNPTLEVCDWPYRAGCAGGSGSSAAPSSPTAAPTTAAPTPAPTSAPTPKPTAAPSGDCPAVGSCPQYEDENSIAKHLPHASNCTKFCKCDHGKPVTFDCPAGLHFNPKLEVCDWPYRAGCTSGSS